MNGLQNGQSQARDALHSTVRAAEHLRLIADLVPVGVGGDFAGADFAVNLAGVDLAPDLSQPDLAGADLAGVDLGSDWQIEAIPDSFIKMIWGTTPATCTPSMSAATSCTPPAMDSGRCSARDRAAPT